ncbi:hypothetical protein SAMN02927921_02454 [Sinomicrobium oceani]|uniref:Uncharacterized protein n=1 Tax=Sinomicrobium oceani TaxID=1150368 RepID=A0A1K1QE34_9FLAO|nr:hypothetical protein SAMN02927921_02454 [Sinomicrobium oceani]
MNLVKQKRDKTTFERYSTNNELNEYVLILSFDEIPFHYK